ncbi:DNA polymerase I [Lapidilactobacillus gannanensis]|uniref:DNA polymerase I n=1 Tax=Lapidilactobacillus gannanensis TaxID=2486002 RepID=A0ABW4BM87_9LACO|nr:DNA polymerase I [Lapidilactobacillus gannanensis]
MAAVADVKQDKLLLLDGNSLAFRAFFALHNSLDRFTNSEGLHTNALYTFSNMLETILAAEQPTHMLVAFDAGKTTFRTQMFDDYKGNRSKTPSELSEQLPYFGEYLDALGIAHYQLVDYEADDIIGTLAKEAQGQMPVTIITGDRDLTQLTTANTTVKVTVKGVNELETYTPAHVQEKLGITPKQIIDMKGLMGDTSDNYPGVTKVGEKTALKLVKEYGSIETLYQHVAEMKKSKLKENLENDHEQAVLSKKLATINTAAPLTISLADIKRQAENQEKLIAFYEAMDFKSKLAKLQISKSTTSADADAAQKINAQELVAADLPQILKSPQPQAFEIDILGDNYHLEMPIGFAIGAADHWYYSQDLSLLTTPEFKAWLANRDHEKYVFDSKKTEVLLTRLGAPIAGMTFDLLLVSYLLNTFDNSNDLGVLAHLHGYQAVQTDLEVYGKGTKRAVPMDPEVLGHHLACKAQAIYRLKTPLLTQLKDNDQDQLYDEIEAPLALVLAQMELNGITVDSQRLQTMRLDFEKRLNDIQALIYEDAGHEFNINSPKQLGTVLFDELKLPVIKKNKTGYSTSVEVLEQLQGDNPIIDRILTYRQISKLQSTYITGLLKVIHPDHKVHTRYLQTLTQTGRLSSVDPNLQNIPVRLPEGRKIRQAFVPSHPDWEIFSSDYSQVELRVLAHVSGDANMQAAFKNKIDIHANTAMKIFHLADPSEVTPDMRRQAKATNFGIVYGISDYGLARNIGISRTQAANFIAAYFEQYPDVERYVKDIVEVARQQGYVETIMHRRRYLPDIHAKNYNLRSFAERTAMNTPIQGSAADIIKVAMINMQQRLAEENLQAKMLLQVHDELIFEAPATEIPILEKLVPSVMDSAVKLDVPLVVDSAHGPTWYDAKG